MSSAFAIFANLDVRLLHKIALDFCESGVLYARLSH